MLDAYLVDNIHPGMTQQEVGHELIGLRYSSASGAPSGLVYFQRCTTVYFLGNDFSNDIYEFDYTVDGYLEYFQVFYPP